MLRISRNDFPPRILLLVSLILTGLSGALASQEAEDSKEIDLIELSKGRKNCCGTTEAERIPNLSYPDSNTYKLTATYFTLRGNVTTTLMLNNKAGDAVLAIPTVYSLTGSRLSLPPISVPGTSYIDLDMNQLLNGAADEFREGSIKISYDGVSQQLGAQIKMIDSAKNLIWAEQFVYTTKFVSSRLENLWWLPYENSETKVVVSNTSSGTITATLLVEGTSPDQLQPLQITLAPWATRVLDILHDIAGRQNGHVHDKGGISITHSGAPGVRGAVTSEIERRCVLRLEGGGSQKTIGLDKIKVGLISNIYLQTLTINYSSGTRRSGPDPDEPVALPHYFKHNDDSVSGVFRIVATGSGTNRTVLYTKEESILFPPFYPNSQNSWVNSLGGPEYEDFISAYSQTFPNAFAVIAHATVRVSFNGQSGKPDHNWLNNGATIFFNNTSSSDFNPQVDSGGSITPGRTIQTLNGGQMNVTTRYSESPIFE